MPRIAFALLLALVAGCAATRRPEKAQVTLTSSGDARVGTYVSSPWGFSTSSYWIEGPEGLILIDTQFLLSAAEEFVSWAEQVTGKKAVLAIVLHANPDKFNGTEVLRKRGIRVVTSEQVRALIPGIHEIRTKAFYARYKPDYPTEVPLPDSFGSATTELSAGGVTVKAHVLGAGCSEAHVVVEYDGHLFTGDLVANNAHSWLEIGKTDEWLKRMDELQALKPKFVHPGRGPSGTAGLLEQERAYLERVIAEVAAERPQGELAAEARERIKSRLFAAYPGLRFGVFLEIGLPAEWRRQAQASAGAQ
jgi:glyoxylase-like metal-dependent hydrolase (beta-lactamase superfamily II)